MIRNKALSMTMLALCLALSTTAADSTSVKYIPEVLFQTKWGSKMSERRVPVEVVQREDGSFDTSFMLVTTIKSVSQDEFGLEFDTQEVKGPRAIAVQKGIIYILDPFRLCVTKYTMKGKLIKLIKFERVKPKGQYALHYEYGVGGIGDGLLVDSLGQIYVQGLSPGLLEFNAKGKFICKVDITKRKEIGFVDIVRPSLDKIHTSDNLKQLIAWARDAIGTAAAIDENKDIYEIVWSERALEEGVRVIRWRKE